MKRLNQYIFEKFKISKNTKIQYSHNEFKSKNETFKYIKSLCKGFGFRTTTENYWLYVYKNENSDFPGILFTYGILDQKGQKINHLCTGRYKSGSQSNGNILICTGQDKYKEIPYPDDFDVDKYNYPYPTEYNINYTLNLLNEYEEN